MTAKQLHRKYISELAREVLLSKLEGVFIECGVKYGSTAYRIAEILKCPSYLFDTWNKLEGFSHYDGNNARKQWIKKRNASKAEKDCRNLLDKHDVSDICTMIKGDVRKTMPVFLANHNELKCCFAHLDLDLYKPTLFCLEIIWDIILGPIFFHDYGSKKWTGVKLCVDKFVKSKKAALYIYPDIRACIIRKK